MSSLETLEREFVKQFGSEPHRITRAPGRVNLIGEHTDYNDGFVLPMAIDRAVWIAARKRDDRIVRMVALDFGGARSEFSLDYIEPDPKHASKTPRSLRGWSNYVRGVAQALSQRGLNPVGADLLIHGNVPIGSGLSSSAALEVCAAVTFLKLVEVAPMPPNCLGVEAQAASIEMDRVELARLCQRAENEFIGVQSGIMDQFVSLFAREGHALFIDCRDLSYEQVPLPRGAAIVVCDTKKRRGLMDSEYNARRAECKEAARLLGVKSLREADAKEFAKGAKDLPPIIFRRARHVISENARVMRAVEACKRNDLATFGRLMNESHASLRDDYAVSCAELDAIVEIAQGQAGCFGARLTGAGFGGCTVNLIEERAVPGFMDASRVAAEYTGRVGIAPEIFVCRASEGAG